MVEPYSNPKNSQLGPQEVKYYPKIKSKSKVRIERNIENEICSTTWVDSKTVVKPYLKIANQGTKSQKLPQNYLKTNIRIDQNIQNELWLNLISTSLQPQPQFNLNLNLNLNSIWLWHKSNPILLE